MNGIDSSAFGVALTPEGIANSGGDITVETRDDGRVYSEEVEEDAAFLQKLLDEAGEKHIFEVVKTDEAAFVRRKVVKDSEEPSKDSE
jgi:hypothetical protein